MTEPEPVEGYGRFVAGLGHVVGGVPAETDEGTKEPKKAEQPEEPAEPKTEEDGS